MRLGVLAAALLLLLLGASATFFVMLPSEGYDRVRVEELSQRVQQLESELARHHETAHGATAAAEVATVAATTVAATAAGPTEAPLSKLRIGCFKDDFGARDLSEYQRGMPSATPARCMHRCALKGFQYAGLQDGGECWCGNSYGRHGHSTACGTMCLADAEMLCGGPLANDVYPAKAMPPHLRDDETFVQPAVPLRQLRSKVSCMGASRENRVCRIENLFYKVDTREFFVQIDSPDDVQGISTKVGDTLFSVSDHCSVTGISAFNLKVVQNLPDADEKARFASGTSYFIYRFLPYNIMHVLHDDITGMFFNMFEYTERHSRPVEPWTIDTDNRVIVLDDHAAGDYKIFLSLLSDRKPVHHGELEPGAVMCFEVAVVGMSRRANWYQYGFGRPQGPIPGKSVSGKDVRLMADFLYERFARYAERTRQQAADPLDIVIFSRTLNRLIVNEGELKGALEAQQPGSRVGFARLETLSLWQIVNIVRHARIAIGMHGSILILCMFMPENAKVIELYPHAVPSNNYTPYKTMANLPGMNLRYTAWENKHEDKTIGHPDRHRLMGGLRELPKAKQDEIIRATTVPTHHCCEDPYWLYKIFQDTIVTVSEILPLTA